MNELIVFLIVLTIFLIVNLFILIYMLKTVAKIRKPIKQIIYSQPHTHQKSKKQVNNNTHPCINCDFS